MIKVNNITKYFDSFKALDNLTMNVKKGTIYGLVGPNGAGKTTIINHITGMLRANSGDVTIDGEPVYENEKIKQRLLSISDDWFYYSTYTVKQMASFYKSIYKNFNDERYETIKKLLNIYHLLIFE